jgi:RimJ/RimL family protein N-acetyltransferase
MDRSPPVSVPRLRTPRLTLREFRTGDFEAFAASLADPDFARFVGGAADRRAAWRVFGHQTGLWLLQGAGWWTVEITETGEVAGSVGAFFRETWPEIEIGWNTHRKHWGRGVATEAAGEAIRYAFDVRGEQRVTALIEARNTPSLRVAAHLGMVIDGETELFGIPLGRYALARALPATTRGGSMLGDS